MDAVDENESPAFTPQELALEIRRLMKGKAPGLDEIVNEMVAEVAKSKPDVILTVMNGCLRETTFSKIWKSARLV